MLCRLFASSNNASSALSLLVVHDDVRVDVSSRNNIGRYLLDLLELLAHILVMRLWDHLLSCVGSSATHWDHGLTTLVKRVLIRLLLLMLLLNGLVVDGIALGDWL